MGNKQSEVFDWEKNFIILQRNFNDNTLVLQKIGGGEEYLGRELISGDKKQSQQIKRLIQAKYHSNSPFLTKLLEVHYNNDTAYCSPQDKIYLLFERPKQTLRQQILARKFANEPFSEEEADIILESGAKAIRYLKQMRHPHNNISTSSLFVDKDRRILLGDPWVTPPVYSQDLNQNAFACPSPQKILLQNDQILTICPYKSDLFSLGTVVLQALNFQHMDVLYEKGFRKVIQARVKQKLAKIQNQSLRYKLSVVLSYDPKNRDQIYNLYRTPSVSVSQVRSKVINNANSEYPSAQNNSMKKNISKNRIGATEQQRFHSIPSTPIKNIPVSKITQQHYPNIINRPQIYSNPPISKTPPKYQFTNINSPIPQQSNIRFKYDNNTYKPLNPIIQRTSNLNPIYPVGNNLININIPNSQPRLNEIKTNIQIQNNNNVVDPNPIHITDANNMTIINGLSKVNSQKISQQIHESNVNNFQPILIQSGEDLVKTSGNVRFIDNSSTFDKNKSKSFINQSQSHEQIENIQHIGNYGVKNIGELGIKTPVQSFEVIPRQEVGESNINRKTGSDLSDKVFLDSINQTQNQPHPHPIPTYTVQSRSTPERRPTKKYNSTIKQDPQENSYSGSKDGEEDMEYVVEEYEAGRYEGQKKNGMRNGYGKFHYNEGSVYDGYWKDNLMHGKGSLYYSNGKLAYEGQWRMDEFHGYGKVYNQDQQPIHGSYDYTDLSDVNDYWASYQGELNSDRRHGKGKIKFSNGQIFSGHFVSDIADGQGKFYTMKGDIIHGIWKNNKLIRRL